MAPIREKALIVILATGCFRIGNLAKLGYRHVRQNLEANRVVAHVHVEAELARGEYCDFDTFINEEAANYLKLYLAEGEGAHRKHRQKR